MQIHAVQAVYSPSPGDLRCEYPVNLRPSLDDLGVGMGSFRATPGLTATATGPGVTRGAIVWSDTLYRVMGSKLCSFDSLGAVTVLGDVGDDGLPARLTYGFDRIAVVSAGDMYYWDGALLTQVTDSDLGTPIDVQWADGYYLTTDGEYLVVTELADPMVIDPLKYGSVEADPDPVQCLLRLRTEVIAVGRYSVEFFSNTGGTGFPFSRISGAQLTRGAVGRQCACLFAERVVLLGGGRGEVPAIWWGINGTTDKLSTPAIEGVLAQYSDSALASAALETVIDDGHQLLLVHLSDQTLAYDLEVSAAAGKPIWHRLSSASVGTGRYNARDFARAYGRWWAGDPRGGHGYLDPSVSTHWGVAVLSRIDVPVRHGMGRGVMVSAAESIAIYGDLAAGTLISMSHSLDGSTWTYPSTAAAMSVPGTRCIARWVRRTPEIKRVIRFDGALPAGAVIDYVDWIAPVLQAQAG